MEPWIGSRYFSSPFRGERLLILGESEYEWEKGCLIPDVATQLISKIADGTWNYRFYSKIFHVVTGKTRAEVGVETRRDFWHSVSFYNFVQDAVGPGPRCRPSMEMWNNAASYFRRVFAELSPEIVLALGKELWFHLNRLGFIEHQSEQQSLLCVNELVARTNFIYHPASSRYNYAVSRNTVEMLFA